MGIKDLILIVVMVLSLGLSGCSSTIEGEKNLENEKWIEDIIYLDENLRGKHPDLFMYVPEKDWEKQISQIKRDVDNLSDQDIALRIAQIISSIQDAHTYVMYSDLLTPIEKGGQDVNEVVSFPIFLKYFNDGMRVIETDSEYKEVLGYKLISINDIEAKEIVEKVSSLTSSENPQSKKDNGRMYMHIYEYLKFLNIVDSEEAKYTFEDHEKNKVTLNIKAKKYKECELEQLESKPMKTSQMPEGENNLYWFKYFEEDEMLFFKYNKCMEFDYYSVEKKLIEEINSTNPNKLVIDLRNNIGGDRRQGESLVNKLRNSTDLKSEDIIVLSGQRTLSAAAILTWKLQTELGATVVGEGPGGNVNAFPLTSLEKPLTIDLPNSNLSIIHPYYFLENEKGYVGGAKADVEVIQNYNDYMNGVDTLYEYVKNMEE
ncbi:MAG: hypothetical protein ACRDA4_05615 [Filifactoraceae bacterium]